jgi:fluoroacetyl-CoA thioesterase
MKEMLRPGLEFTLHYQVPKNKTVPHLYPESGLFQAMPEVFATGFMVGFIEWACMEALAPHLHPGEGTVGTMINVTHEAATPPGMQVTARVRCTAVEGRKTRWEVEARDEVDVIGRGQHERFTIDLEKFTARLAAKQRP